MAQVEIVAQAQTQAQARQAQAQQRVSHIGGSGHYPRCRLLVCQQHPQLHEHLFPINCCPLFSAHETQAQSSETTGAHSTQVVFDVIHSINEQTIRQTTNEVRIVDTGWKFKGICGTYSMIICSCFILYRRHLDKVVLAPTLGEKSVIIGRLWRNESPEAKTKWKQLA